MARPALALGLSLALLETLNDIGATDYLGVRTLTVSIYTTWVNRGSLEGAAQIACVMLAVVAFILWLERRGRGARRFSASVKRPRQATPQPLRGWPGIAASLACALPVTIGFLVPAGFLIREAAIRTLARRRASGFRGVSSALPSHMRLRPRCWSSCWAPWSPPPCGWCAARRVALPGARRCARLCHAGHGARRGPAVAVGGLDNAMANAIRAATGVSPGLILTGSGAAVVIAYAVRFLGIASGGIESGMSRISTHIDDAARTLGRRPGELIRQIHLPLARPALISAALLVFVDAMKELPATLLLRPLNVDTLATSVYASASRGVFEEGALAALAIVLVGLVPVWR